jgi:hypothetical protein
MPRYAKGKRSFGMSDRGGHRVPYTQLKTTWDGLRVAPDEWEAKHPQLTPPKNVIDATALFKPRPSSDAENVTIFIAHTFDPFADPRTRKTVGVAGYGNTNRVDNEEIRSFPQPSGVGGTGAVGTETPLASITETGLGGTGAVGTETLELSITETGVGGTGAVGVEAFESSITETGLGGTGGVGVEIPVVEVTGVSASGGAGSVGVEALNLSITETGVAGTGGVGTENVVVSLTETGVGGTGGVGTESVTVDQEWGSGAWNEGAWGQ